MHVTNLRMHGKRLTLKQVETIGKRVASALKRAGYVTDVHNYSTGGFSISTGGFSCFTVDPKVHGYNARHPWVSPMGHSHGGASVVGWKRTTVPTWEQRVDFNNTVNRVLDSYGFGGLTCRIKSGPFIIRDVTHGAYHSWDTYALPGGGPDIVTLTPEMEAEARDARRAHQRLRSRIARERKAGKRSFA